MAASLLWAPRTFQYILLNPNLHELSTWIVTILTWLHHCPHRYDILYISKLYQSAGRKSPDWLVLSLFPGTGLATTVAVEDCHLLSSSSSLSLLALTWVICRDSWLPLRIVILSRNLTCGSVGMSSVENSANGLISRKKRAKNGHLFSKKTGEKRAK